MGELQPGQKLQIEKVRKDYGASAASVREALSILTGEKYVRAVDQRGFFVMESSLEELYDLTRVRAELECVAFCWSISNTSREWRAEVVSCHHILQEAEAELLASTRNHILEWDEANRSFHLALASNCGSNSLVQLIRDQYDLTRRYRLRAYSHLTRGADHQTWLRKSAEEHDALKEAALSEDVEAGVKLLRKHITKAPVDSPFLQEAVPLSS